MMFVFLFVILDFLWWWRTIGMMRRSDGSRLDRSEPPLLSDPAPTHRPFHLQSDACVWRYKTKIRIWINETNLDLLLCIMMHVVRSMCQFHRRGVVWRWCQDRVTQLRLRHGIVWVGPILDCLFLESRSHPAESNLIQSVFPLIRELGFFTSKLEGLFVSLLVHPTTKTPIIIDIVEGNKSIAIDSLVLEKLLESSIPYRNMNS